MSQTSVPDCRTYRHLTCGSETTIHGQPFEVMSNPLSDMASTWCSQCEGQFPLSEYAWADTDEKVLDYYARHSARATGLQRFLCSRKCMILLGAGGLLLGAVSGFLPVRNGSALLKFGTPVVLGAIGGFAGLAIYISALCGPITRKVVGVSDTRTLK